MKKSWAIFFQLSKWLFDSNMLGGFVEIYDNCDNKVDVIIAHDAAGQIVMHLMEPKSHSFGQCS